MINIELLARQFINEHNDNKNWSPFDRLETMAIIMYAKWLESRIHTNEEPMVIQNL